MKRIHLGLALFFVVVLISAASWTRLAQAKKPDADLVTIQDPASTNTIEAAAALADLTAGISTSTPDQGNLTDTDLVSRQLLSDYIDLSANGQATDEQIGKLADTYASQIAALSAVPALQLSDILPVSNNSTNFRTYADTFTAIERGYAAEIASINPGKLNLTELGPDTYLLAATFSKAYKDAAAKLEKLPVPAALVTDHLKLINLYLSSGQSMDAISKIDSDSIYAFSGLLNFNTNLDNEQATVQDISRILTDNGQ